MDRALGGGDENHMLLYFGYTHLQYIATTYFDASNHIFHTMLVNLMSRWFGEENAVAIRMPTFLFGLATLWMTYEELNPESYLVSQGMSVVSHPVLIDSSIKNDYNSPLRFAKKSRNPVKGGTIEGQKNIQNFLYPDNHINIYT